MVDGNSGVPVGHFIQVVEQPVCKKGCNRGHQPAECLQAFIKSLIGADLVMFIFAFPEPAAAESYIPVAQVFIHEIFDGPAGNSGFVFIKILLR